MIYVMARIDWLLALVALTIAPVLFIAARLYDKRMGSQYEAVQELESRALGVVQEALTAVRVVKAFGRENSEEERFVRHSSEGVRRKVRLAFAEGLFGSMVNVVTAVGTGLVLFIGVRHVQSGILTLGALYMVITYLTELYGPLERMSNQIAALQTSLISAKRAFEILDEAPEVVERPNARPLKRATGAVELRGVSFGYDERNVILDNVSIAVPAGARVGIAGRTGAGKSTLVSLLTRFYDPSEGEILVDGLDLRDYKLADLRNQFALVLQDSVLFSTSIAENIAYARPEATDDEIRAAAMAARAHDFIEALPDGYETQVGERGMMVSGGERQRISLARAFLKNAPILILDEPTSAVDIETEGAILEAMERLMHGRTSFVISHRLSALEKSDLLLVFENGRGVRVYHDVSAALGTSLVSAARASMLDGPSFDPPFDS
jgi:ATP-binding cassette subfamily B protein